MPRDLKGLVLAGGEISRLRPLTLSVPKHLIPLAGRAMIEYPVGHLVKAGVVDFGVVVGHLGHFLREYLGDGSRLGARLRYVEQGERLGIAHAIHLAIEAGAVDGPFVVYLGDNILAGGVAKHVERFREGEPDVYILLSRVKGPSRFGVAVLRDGRVVRLVEKPKEPISDMAVVGVYMFRDPDLVERAFRSLKPSWRGEYEVTDLIQWFIDNGHGVAYDVVDGWWKDVGTPESLLEALYLLLDSMGGRVEGEVSGEVVGRVVVERGAVVEQYASLEAGARALSGAVSRSLVMDETVLDLGRLRLVDSVVGRRSVVKCGRELHGEIRLAVSDFSRVEL